MLPTGTVADNVAAGGYHSLAAVTAGGLYAWGLNEYGQLGLAPNDATSASKPTLVDMPSGVSATQLAAGLYHSMAVGSDGNLYAWGYNADQELGRGRPPSGHPQGDAAGRWRHAGRDLRRTLRQLRAPPSGTLYVWGRNGLGQLDDGNLTATLSQEAVSFPPGSTVTMLALDSSSSDQVALATRPLR